jgi:hypothetical protein
MQNLAVGQEAAEIARGEIAAANPILQAGGDLAEFLILGGIAKGVVGAAGKALLGEVRAAQLGTRLAVGKNSGVLRKTGDILAQDAAVELHFYTQGIIGNRQGFVAEDAAQQIGVGMLFAAPFIGGAAIRAGARKIAKTVGPSVLGTVASGFQLGAVLSKAGSGAAHTNARRAGGASILNKVFRRAKGKGKGLGATDEMAAKQAAHLEDQALVGGFTPEQMRRKTPTQRREILERMKKVGDENLDHLDDINYETLHTRTSRMSRSVDTLRREGRSINRKMAGPGRTVKFTKAQEQAVIAKGNELIGHMQEAGMEEAAAVIRRGILKRTKVVANDGTVSTQLNHMEAHKALFQARIEARFMRGHSGGADIVDDSLRAFTEDVGIFGASNVRKNKIINEGIDEVVSSWDELGKTHIPKNLEDIEIADAMQLKGLSDETAKLRAGMEKLEDAGMLSRGQVKAMTTKFIDTGEAIFEGTAAYGDVIQINRARKGAAGRLQKHGEVMFDIPVTEEGFAAQQRGMVEDTLKDMAKLGGAVFDALTSHKIQVAGARGVTVLHSMVEDDKRKMFEAIQDEIPQLTGNPTYAMDKLAPILDRSAAADPKFADLLGQKITNTLYYLAQELPVPDQTVYGRGLPQPLSKVEDFLEKYVASQDNISVVYAAIEGRATRGMVDAVRNTAPEMYAELSVMVSEALGRVPADDANPRVVTGLSLFLGNMDQMYTGEFLSRLQSNYAQTQTQDEVIQGSQGGPNNRPLDAKNNQTTTSQRQQTI